MYPYHLAQVPDSCCISPGRYCGVRSHPSNIRYTGCIDRIQRIAGDHLIIVGAVALGIALVQVRGVQQCCQMAKFDPFLSLDCARVEGVGTQSKERKGSNFAL